jgi:hypothetical protein
MEGLEGLEVNRPHARSEKLRTLQTLHGDPMTCSISPGVTMITFDQSHCTRCLRVPETDDPEDRPPDREAQTDTEGNAIGVICPGCLNPQRSAGTLRAAQQAVSTRINRTVKGGLNGGHPARGTFVVQVREFGTHADGRTGRRRHGAARHCRAVGLHARPRLHPSWRVKRVHTPCGGWSWRCPGPSMRRSG